MPVGRGLGDGLGTDRAARAAAFSITTGCPIVSLMRCAMSRATTSVVPPTGNGTTIRSGLLGKP